MSTPQPSIDSLTFFANNRPSDCEKGFDIVIGNPPYIDSETMTLLGQEEMRTYIAKTYKYIKGNWDIYMAFMEQGLRLCPNGYLCFITPDKWLSRPFGAKFREFCMIPRMNSIAHTGNQTFKSAMVDAMRRWPAQCCLNKRCRVTGQLSQ